MKHFLSFSLLFPLFFFSCNKDEDIVIDQPSGSELIEYTVIEYTPAPGQFINDPLTGFDDITTQTEASLQAQKRLSEGKYVSLGAWGGYIIVKFNNSIENSGDYDFAISCNAFDTSNEPGIVWVMKDENGNGKADDEWYELKGSQFGKDGYERNYWVTYTKPGPNEDTHWIDSNGETGMVKWMGSYHNQEYYYPLWIKEESYTLSGSRLPSRLVQNPITGVWDNQPFEWGYADNFGTDFFAENNKNLFKISDAVKEDNTPAKLSSIDFIKVQTAVNSNANLIGENSTEVCGFFRLTPL